MDKFEKRKKNQKIFIVVMSLVIIISMTASIVVTGS